MTEITPEEQAIAIAEEARNPETFNLLDALEQKETSYPERSVTVYLNGFAAGRLIDIADEIADLKVELATLQEQNKGSKSVAGDPDEQAIEEKIEALHAEEVEVVATVKESALTFRMRGVAPAVWHAIDKRWRAKIKAKSDAPEDQEEAMMERNDKVNYDTIAHSIVSVTNGAGAVDKSGLTVEKVEKLHGVLVMSEWQKLKDNADILTFSNGIFQRVVEEDADFLPKP